MGTIIEVSFHRGDFEKPRLRPPASLTGLAVPWAKEKEGGRGDRLHRSFPDMACSGAFDGKKSARIFESESRFAAARSAALPRPSSRRADRQGWLH